MGIVHGTMGNKKFEVDGGKCMSDLYVYLLDQLKKEKLIVKNMTKQEKEQLLEYMDLIYGNLISRLKKDFKLTSGNLILIALLVV